MWAALLGAIGPIGAALIAGFVANRIRERYQLEKDRQDKDAQWRQHAIDLTKLELERKIELLKAGEAHDIRTVIDDFLAFYRDLNELGPTGRGEKSVKQLYLDIMTRRKNFPAGELVANVRASLYRGEIRQAEDLVIEAKIRAMEEALAASHHAKAEPAKRAAEREA